MARTKGSKNGISRTKGYTAVGQRAKGRFVNGRYVYDYGAQNNWQQMAADAQRKAEAKARWQAGNKAMAGNKAKEQGANNNWQQQGNHFRAADEAVNRMAQERSDNAYIGNGSKAANAAMKKYLRDDGVALRRDESYRNALNIHEHKKQMANSERLMKTKSAINYGDPRYSVAGTNKVDRAKNNWQQQAALEQWKQQNRNNISAKKKAEATKDSVANASKAGEKNNWQDKAESSRQKSELYNKMIEKRTKGITGINKKTGDTEVHTMGVNPKNNMLYYNPVKITKKGAATTGAQNNWQQKAAREAAGTESQNKVTNGSARATYMPRRHGGDAYVNPNNLEIDTTRKPNKTKGANAMRNDPRYTQNVSAQKSLAASKALKSSVAESKIRNSRSDIGNALADAKEDARKAWKKLFSKKKKKK